MKSSLLIFLFLIFLIPTAYAQVADELDKAYVLTGVARASVTSTNGGSDANYLGALIGYEKFIKPKISLSLELGRAVSTDLDIISNNQNLGASYYFRVGNVTVTKINGQKIVRYSPYAPFINFSISRRDFEGDTLSYMFLGFSARGGIDIHHDEKTFIRIAAGMEQIQSGNDRSANIVNVLVGLGINF